MNRTLRLLKSNISIAVSEPSQEITSQSIANGLIVPSASYQLIPGHSQANIIDIDALLIWFLPYSKQKLIDITLPYTTINRNKQQVRLLARYMLFGRKLVGIRICQCKEWSIGRIQMQSPSYSLQKYYRQHEIRFSHKEILVGSFYLQLNNCRIGLLFENELLETPSLLRVYDRYKCDILSIVTCKQKQINKETHTFKINLKEKQLLNRLKKRARQQQITLIFAGTKIVPSLQIVYWQKSFIMQGNKLATQPKTLIGDKRFICLVARLDITQTQKWAPMTSQSEEDNNAGAETCLEKKDIDGWLRYQDIEEEFESQIPASKRTLSDFVSLKEITLYNLYYLYETVNQRSPFVLAHPFSIKASQIFEHLLLLTKHSRIQANQLVKLYSTQQTSSVIEQITVYPCFLSMINDNKGSFSGLIYVYCDDSREIRKLRENEAFGAMICNCESLIPFTGEDRRARQQAQNTKTIPSKKLDNACVHVLKERFQSFEEMLSYFQHCRFNKQQIQECFTQILPNKVRRFLKLTPYYLFLLHSRPEKILDEVGESEIRLKSQGHSRIFVEEQVVQDAGQPSRRLAEKIEAARAFKRRLNHHPKCHRCSIAFRKDLTHKCEQCANILCLDCLDTLTHHSLFQLQHYKCVICLAKCDCKNCKTQGPSSINHDSFGREIIVHPQFNSRTFRCTRCEILGVSYDFIRIECRQCKQLRCYNCARMNKDFDSTKLTEWLCDDCKEFNARINQQSLGSKVPLVLLEDRPVQESEALKEAQRKQQPMIAEPKKVEKPNLVGSKPYERQPSSSSAKSNRGRANKHKKKHQSKRHSKTNRRQISRQSSRSRSRESPKQKEKDEKKPLWGKQKPKGTWKKDNPEKKNEKTKAFWSEHLKDVLKKDHPTNEKDQPPPKTNATAHNNPPAHKNPPTYKKPSSGHSGLIFEMEQQEQQESFSY